MTSRRADRRPDRQQGADEVVAACVDAGVSFAAPIALHVRSSIRDYVIPWVGRAYPHLVPLYEELYGKRAYAPKAYQQELSAPLHARPRPLRPRALGLSPPAPAAPAAGAARARCLNSGPTGQTGAMALPHRGLRPDRRHADGGAGRAGRVDRLAVPAALRLRCLLRRAARRTGARPLADRPGGPRPARSSGATAATSLVLETEFDTDDGAVRVDRLHAAPRARSRRGSHRRGRRAAACRCGCELVIRFDYGSIVPWVRQLDGRSRAIGRAGRALPADAGRAARART